MFSVNTSVGKYIGLWSYNGLLKPMVGTETVPCYGTSTYAYAYGRVQDPWLSVTGKYGIR